MGTTLHAPHPWPHITANLRGPGPHRVAIAYLDHTAPDLLPLRAGDQLIVNAARPAVRAHATSPTALAHFLNAGVRVLSTPNLHTGLILTGETVIVGPASASISSTVADETALITDDPDAIAAAHAFLDDLEDTVVVDDVFLDSATAIWQTGRVVPLQGSAAAPAPVTIFFLPPCAGCSYGTSATTPAPTTTKHHGPQPPPAETGRIRATAPHGSARTLPVPTAAPSCSPATSSSGSASTTPGCIRRPSSTPARTASPTPALRWPTGYASAPTSTPSQ
ncbi:hypothetical protein [Rhodococcus pyridinivorans]|uniref:hypothetical protein n=1 Tax=Rhodococcus pyridinivorans TaxID=103816 RepID=UPI0031F6FF1E